MVQELTAIRPEKTGGMTGFDANINGKTYMAKHILIIHFSCKLERCDLVPVFCTALFCAIPDELWISHFLWQ